MGYEWLFVGGLVVILSYSIYYVIKSASEIAILRLLAQKGVIVEGSVDGFKRVAAGRPYYRIQYSFVVEQQSQKQEYSGEQGLNWNHFRRLWNSKLITIAYLSDHPQISRLYGKDADNFDRNYQFIMAFISFVVFPPLIIAWFALLQLNLKRWAR